MKIIFSILINALILFSMTFLLNTSLETWIIVAWWLKTYIIWWIILWLINITIKPILKLVTLPLFFLFFWLVVFIINWIILMLFDFIINNLLIIQWVSYTINWNINLVIAVAIFTILNMFYSLLFSKR